MNISTEYYEAMAEKKPSQIQYLRNIWRKLCSTSLCFDYIQFVPLGLFMIQVILWVIYFHTVYLLHNSRNIILTLFPLQFG